MDIIESRGGGTKYINEQLQALITEYPKAAEFEIAVKVALLNWTSGIANNFVRYGICSGFDAWRKLCHKYVLLAEDLQDILIQELMALKPVSENELDILFNEIQRITDLYSKTGKQEDLSDRWVRSAILKNIPDTIAKDLAMDLRKASSADDMQGIINVYRHDHRTGLERDIPGPMICATAEANTEEDTHKKEPTQEQKTEATNEDTGTPGTSINAATKGGTKTDKGKQNGYGQCWECGEYMRPRRECKVYLERIGAGQQQQDISALKGKHGKGGKWGKGKGMEVRAKAITGPRVIKDTDHQAKLWEKDSTSWAKTTIVQRWDRKRIIITTMKIRVMGTGT